MSENSQNRGRGRPYRQTQSGTAAVELAVVILVFLIFIFATLELARAMYMFNTLHEVTRRASLAAANTNFKDESAKAEVRQRALFRSTSGTLPLGEPITDAHIRIDYLSLVRNGAGTTPTFIPTLPDSPAENRVICSRDPNHASCVRLVRVRVCQPADSCTACCQPVAYKTIFPLIKLPLQLPVATTIVKAGTLGLATGNGP